MFVLPTIKKKVQSCMNLTSFFANKCFEFLLKINCEGDTTISGATTTSSSLHPRFSPPWVRGARSLQMHCDGCGNCLAHCESGILVRDADGCPQVDFSLGACNFCGACAESCSRDVFTRTQSGFPWSLKARINGDCLLHNNVLCRTCAEYCEYDAIVFAPAPGAMSPPRIAADRCTGCGACFAPCPVGAIAILNTATSEKS
jgi:ferredoxin-type protein NapF